MAANGNDPKDIYLADLRAQVERLNALIAAVESGGEGLAFSGMASSRRIDTQVRPDSFFGMNTPGAVKRFLEMVGKGNPQTPPAIVEALIQGGIWTGKTGEADRDVLMKNVYTALGRGDGKDFVKIGKVWGLKDWYGDRDLKTLDEKPKKNERPKKTAKTSKAKRASADSSGARGNLQIFNQFVKDRRAAGKTRVEAIAEWRARGTQG